MSSQDSNRTSSKQSLEKLIETLELSDLQKQFLRSRWLEQVSWMGGRARNARNWYYRLRLTAIIGGIIVPILVGLNISDKNVASSVRWFTIGLSGVVAISSAVEEFFHYGDRWRHYRHTAESLKTQGWQFSQLSGLYNGYKSHQEAFPNFATQIEDILQRDVDVYVTEVVYKKEKQNQEGEQELIKGIIPQSPTDNKASEKNIS
ncbi:DUF4231 domain-containing protein [Mastigocladopsis repens]|uniref:DUF4231 domain-containing protein n=1 Tax=Mastigocladopsis repens TaxID=221287 RepID=UPI000300D4D5|nr:DUF4231 domain-containing protein [Mastigocladopsis repens]